MVTLLARHGLAAGAACAGEIETAGPVDAAVHRVLTPAETEASTGRATPGTLTERRNDLSALDA
jgi:hypothetical protein